MNLSPSQPSKFLNTGLIKQPEVADAFNSILRILDVMQQDIAKAINANIDGDSAQQFSVAAATAAAHAVRLDQLNAAGRVIQTVVGTPTAGLTVSTNSATFVTFGATGIITPTSASNKILVLVTQNVFLSSAGDEAGLTITRDGTDLSTASDGLACAYSIGAGMGASMAMSIYDAPASISAITYISKARKISGAGPIINGIRGGNLNTITLMEIAG